MPQCVRGGQRRSFSMGPGNRQDSGYQGQQYEPLPAQPSHRPFIIQKVWHNACQARALILSYILSPFDFLRQDPTNMPRLALNSFCSFELQVLSFYFSFPSNLGLQVQCFKKLQTIAIQSRLTLKYSCFCLESVGITKPPPSHLTSMGLYTVYCNITTTTKSKTKEICWRSENKLENEKANPWLGMQLQWLSICLLCCCARFCPQHHKKKDLDDTW